MDLLIRYIFDISILAPIGPILNLRLWMRIQMQTLLEAHSSGHLFVHWVASLPP